MSVRIAVVCEDPTYDQYIAKPIIEAAMKAVGRPRAIVRVVHDPKTRGWTTLLASIPTALARWGAMADLVIFVADADCEDGVDGRPARKLQIKRAIERAKSSSCAVGLVAIQEIEVWACWGQADTLGVTWQEVREECHPKERFFDSIGNSFDRLPDGGRGRLVAASLERGGWRSLRTACAELGELEDRLRECFG